MPVARTSDQFNADAVSSLPGPGWLRQQRLSAWERFSALSWPSEADEIWRYSRIGDLDLERYAPRAPDPAARTALDDLPAPLRHLVNAAGPEATVLVTHNGGLGRVIGPQPGLAVAPAGESPLGNGGEPPPALAGPRADIWTALNAAFVQVPWRVTVAPGADIAAPLVVLHWLEGDGCRPFPSPGG